MKRYIAIVCIVALVFMPYLLGASFGTGIKSIQRGTGSKSVNAESSTTDSVTITSVDTTKTIVNAWYYGTASGAYAAPYLTDSTTLTLYLGNGAGSAKTVYYTYEVVEYY